MPANIEIKARARDFDGIRSRAAAISDSAGETIRQQDTFFITPRGRLKLRELEGSPAQLIYYERPDQEGPKRSDYQVFETSDAESLKTMLRRAYGVRGVVRKTRFLYLAGQTRIHVDDVEGLGRFMELEVMLRPGQTDAEGQGVAQALMKDLGVEEDDLLEEAYVDLLERREDATNG
jgi:predicted adenylyl cyclase CyaB